MTVYGVRHANHTVYTPQKTTRAASAKRPVRPVSSAAAPSRRPAMPAYGSGAAARPYPAGYRAASAAGTAPAVRRRPGAAPIPSRRVQPSPQIGVGDLVDILIGPKVAVAPAPRVKYRTLKASAEKRTPVPVPFIAGLLMIVAMVAYLLMLYVQMNESENSINTLKRQITAEQQLKGALEAQKNSREDIRFIEEQAVALGMVKKETLAKKYVSVVAEDKVEVFNDNQSQSTMDGIMSAIGDKIKSYLP